MIAIVGFSDRFHRSTQIMGEINGIQCQCDYFEGGDERGDKLKVLLVKTFPCKFEITLKAKNNRSPKFRTGDPQFDEKFEVRSSKLDLVNTLLSDARPRLAIQKIFDCGLPIEKIKTSPNSLEVSIRDLYGEIDSNILVNVISLMNEVR